MKKYEEPGMKITRFSEESVVTVSIIDQNEAAAEKALREENIQNLVKRAYSTLEFK